jgi:hypothetical protein
LRGVVAGLLGCLVAGGAVAAPNSAQAQAQAQFERERAACISGQSHQDRATCMKEAAAALAEARRGGLSSATASPTARCAVLKGDQYDACIARMQGAGVTSGSVEAGGIYRELIYPDPSEPGSARPVAPRPRPVPQQ